MSASVSSRVGGQGGRRGHGGVAIPALALVAALGAGAVLGAGRAPGDDGPAPTAGIARPSVVPVRSTHPLDPLVTLAVENGVFSDARDAARGGATASAVSTEGAFSDARDSALSR